MWSNLMVFHETTDVFRIEAHFSKLTYIFLRFISRFVQKLIEQECQSDIPSY